MSRYVHMDFDEILKETDKALLVSFSHGEEAWVPLSQIADPDDYKVGDTEGTISVTEWLAKQNGWDGEL